MNPIRKLMLCGAIPFLLVAGAAGRTAAALVAAAPMSHTSDWTMMMMDKLTPEQRTQAIGTQQSHRHPAKMMAMEMQWRNAEADAA